MEKNHIDLTLKFRFVNIDIERDFQLDKNVLLRKMTPEENSARYANDGKVTKEIWDNHTVEAIFYLKILDTDLQHYKKVETAGEFENKILIPLILGRVFDSPLPYATHLEIEAPGFKVMVGYKSMNDYIFSPKIISKDHEKELQDLYYLYNTECDKDIVLSRSIDRLIIAIKGNFQHLNKVNYPNWDKVVDYVISLETLLLTIARNSLNTELAYRFKLNGSTLFSKVIDKSKEQIFKSFGIIYNIRSKAVHGSDDKDIIKEVEKIISILEIDDPDNKHELGRLIILCNLLENWLLSLCKHLITIPIHDRPYYKDGGWEYYLWKT